MTFGASVNPIVYEGGEPIYICAGAVVNHDDVVGAYSQIDCNATVASGARVPEKEKFMSCTVWHQK